MAPQSEEAWVMVARLLQSTWKSTVTLAKLLAKEWPWRVENDKRNIHNVQIRRAKGACPDEAGSFSGQGASGIVALSDPAIDPRRIRSFQWRDHASSPPCANRRQDLSESTPPATDRDQAGTDSAADSLRRRRPDRHQQDSRHDSSSGRGSARTHVSERATAPLPEAVGHRRKRTARDRAPA